MIRDKVVIISTPISRDGFFRDLYLNKCNFDKWDATLDFTWLLFSFRDLKIYTLPRFTLRDHLRDCFGWAWHRHTAGARRKLSPGHVPMIIDEMEMECE